MRQAKVGDRVRVHYTGMLEDGEVFDSSECTDHDCGCGDDDGPLEFVVGDHEVIPGFENGVVGMSPGESRRIVIPMQEAYGEHEENLVATVKRDELPAEIEPEVGQQLEVTQEDGSTFPVMITEVNGDEITLDANHPLAGRDLTFDIRLMEIVE